MADAFDAMTSNHIYRNHMDTDYVINEMKRGRGIQFEPEALDAFLKLVDKSVINLEKLYAQRREEIRNADQKAQAELKNRMEEEKKSRQMPLNERERRLFRRERSIGQEARLPYDSRDLPVHTGDSCRMFPPPEYFRGTRRS